MLAEISVNELDTLTVFYQDLQIKAYLSLPYIYANPDNVNKYKLGLRAFSQFVMWKDCCITSKRTF
jgi:hypothetical protein